MSIKNITFGGISALICLALISCSNNTAPPESVTEETVEVILHTVEFEVEPNRVEAIGTARAKAFAVLYPKTGGEVTHVNFKSGDFVKSGQPLIQLESREETLAVQRAGIALKDSEQLLARYKRIDVEGAISESQIEEGQTALEAAKVDLDLARNTLSERTIKAPFTGYIGFTELDPGARITQQTQIARLDNRSEIFVDFNAPEQVFGDLKVGKTLQMEPFALAGQTYDAEIVAIDSGIDPQGRNFSVRTVIDNKQDELRPGMSFRIGFSLPGKGYPAIPEAAIVWDGDGSYLWAVRNSKATRMPVNIIARKEGYVLVQAPLEAGDQIISEGVQKVREGTPVKTLSAEFSGDYSSNEANAVSVQ